MASYVALLRGINVGGSGRLSMKELSALCRDAGCDSVKTYIQSGNVVLTSDLSEEHIKKKIELALEKKMGRPVGVMVRTGAEIQSVTGRNPFREAAPNRVLVRFLNEAPPRGLFSGVIVPGREEFQLDGREVFMHYPDGMGRSKLKLPLAGIGTGRNLNTVGTLAEMVRALPLG